jgi:hypothetical protein
MRYRSISGKDSETISKTKASVADAQTRQATDA